MEIITAIIQIMVPLGIINVWLIRSRSATSYRGGNASSLKAEFQAYGLPDWSFYGIGGLKLTSAALLLLGFLFPFLVRPGAALMSVLMLGAVVMHAKVGDPPIRFLPALLVLLMSLFLIYQGG